MKVIFHTGAHCTDEDRLLRCLLRNQASFSSRGIAVPGPGRYRELLGQSFGAMAESPPAPDAREVLLDAILDNDSAKRLILSDTDFFGPSHQALIGGQLYPAAAKHITHLQALFPNDSLEVYIALRNPASFLPALLGTVTQKELGDTLGGQDPRQLRWSDCLKRILAVAPELRLTVWCNEDTPLIWAQIIREMAGLPQGEKIVGGFDLLGEIISKEGMQQFRAYLRKHPRMNETQKRNVIAAFLERFGIDEKIEEELDLPGWTDELIEDMTQTYDQDVQHILHMSNVNLITP